MRKLFIVLSLFATLANAAPLSLQFKAVPVVELLEAVVKGAMQQDYYISPQVLTMDAKITLSIKQIEPDRLKPVLSNVLRDAGINFEEREGIFYVTKLQENALQGVAGIPSAAVAGDSARIARSDEAAGNSAIGGANDSPKAQGVAKEPAESIKLYRSKGKDIGLLAGIAKMAGVEVIESKEKDGDSFVIAGKEERVDTVLKLFEDFDRPTVSYLVRAALFEFNDTSNNGRSLSLALDLIGKKLNVTYAAGSLLANSVGYAGSKFNAALSALDTDSRFRHVAEPQIRVMEGQTAKLTVGADVPTRGNAMMDQFGHQISSIQYKTAGVVITVSPRRVEDGIVVKVGQQVSNFAVTTTSNIDSPTILKRDADTVVKTKPGELVMLAGMDEDRQTRSTSGLFFLPEFLRSANHEGNRSQMVLMLELTEI